MLIVFVFAGIGLILLLGALYYLLSRHFFNTERIKKLSDFVLGVALAMVFILLLTLLVYYMQYAIQKCTTTYNISANYQIAVPNGKC
ncbi:MAG: hypothetical protein QXU98_07335 [Candidatus Parvarchaeota archaeon]